MTSYIGYLKVPRWAGGSTFIKDAAHMCNVDLRIDIDRSLFRENVRFEVTGAESKVNSFIEMLENAIEDYKS